jgi:nucleotide-binding universal stress UspA family protein
MEQECAMKSLLIPTDQSELMPSAFACAQLVAERFGAIVDGVALRAAFAEVVAPDPIVAVTIPPTDWDENEFVGVARKTFDTGAGGSPRFRWRGGPSIEDGMLGSLGRLYDLTVMCRPGGRVSRMTAFEAALFDSGRAVLMAPPTPPKSLGESILIHWNCSTETARAITYALPFLTQAKQVMLLTVEGSTVAGPSAKEGLAHLAQHGIKATERTIPATRGKSPGATILDEAAAFGADLLVKGAYTQSRLRQMIFGGATSHILAKAELPVLFSH